MSDLIERLPEPCNKGQSLIGGVEKSWEPLFTAGQLRAHGQQCADAERERCRLALNVAEGALLMCKPCAAEECKAEQQEWIDDAIAAIRSAK